MQMEEGRLQPLTPCPSTLRLQYGSYTAVVSSRNSNGNGPASAASPQFVVGVPATVASVTAASSDPSAVLTFAASDETAVAYMALMQLVGSTEPPTEVRLDVTPVGDRLRASLFLNFFGTPYLGIGLYTVQVLGGCSWDRCGRGQSKAAAARACRATM